MMRVIMGEGIYLKFAKKLGSITIINDTILGHDVIKHIMSGSKFLQITRYLHVCDMKNKVSREHP